MRRLLLLVVLAIVAFGFATPVQAHVASRHASDADRPSAPQNVTATAVGTNGMTITWEPPADAGSSQIASYSVYTFPSTGFSVVSASARRLDLTDLPSGTYMVMVAATNTDGASGDPGYSGADISPQCSVTYTGQDGGDWTDPSNWTPHEVPGVNDAACLDYRSVLISRGSSISVGSLVGGCTLTVDGSLTIDNYFQQRCLGGTGTVTLSPGGRGTFIGVQLADGVRFVNDGQLLLSENFRYSSLTLQGDGSTFDNEGSVLFAGGDISVSEAVPTSGNDNADAFINGPNGTINSVGPAGSDGAIFYAPVVDSGIVNTTGGGYIFADYPLTVSGSPSFVGAVEEQLYDVNVAVGGATLSSVAPISLGGVGGPGVLTLAAGTQTTGESELYDGAHVINKGRLTLEVPSSGPSAAVELNGGSILENKGTLVLPPDGTAVINADGNPGNRFLNDPAGIVTLTAAPASGGIGVAAPFTDSGTITVNSGVLRLRNLTLTGAPTFKFVIAPSSNGRIALFHPMTLKGKLSLVTATNWTPPVGATATLIGGTGALTGRFSPVSGTSVGSNHWAIGYLPKSVTATVKTGSAGRRR